MAKRVRMADIAEKLNVSIVTVSKALNGKDGVGDELRGEVLRTAQEMGYTVKEPAPADTSGLTVGILTSGRYLAKGTSFYWSLYERLLMHLTKAKDFGILEVISPEDEAACTVPRLAEESRVQGLIVVGKLSTDYLDMLAGLDVPFTLLDTYEIGMPYDTVLSAGYSGMCEMTHRLISMGHTRLKFVGSVQATSSIADRYFGFCRALSDAGIPLTADLVIPDRDENGVTQINLPDDLAETVTGLVCNCDLTAYTVLNRLTAMGLRVPQDISIVSFDNYILSEMSSVGITTYSVDQDGMAEASAAQIRRRILHRDAARQIITVSGEMIIRESDAPAKSIQE